jgi:7-cyano-7-deazaguanine reductase
MSGLMFLAHFRELRYRADMSDLTQLGAKSAIPASPDEAKLERAPNPHKSTLYLVRFSAPEFTSICPVTGQPDFGILMIDYAPNDWIVESKSLKLFLQSFRNHGAFHEDCTLAAAKRVIEAIEPKWLRIGGYWNPRGGMPIDVFWQTGAPPEGLWLPEQGIASYTGRK